MAKAPISKTLLKRLWFWIAPDKWRYILVSAMGACMAGLDMIPARLVGNAVNIMKAETFSLGPVFLLVAVWAAVAVTVQVLHGLQINVASKAGEGALFRMRLGVFQHLQRLSMNFFDRVHMGRILACMGADINSLYSVLTWGINTLTTNFFYLAFAAGMIALTDYRLFLATFWVAPMLTFLNFRYGARLNRAWSTIRQQSSLLSADQAENIDGARVVAAFNRQAENLQRFNELQEDFAHSNLNISRDNGLFQPVLQWIRFGGQAILLLYGAYLVVSGTLKPGDLVAALLYWDWFSIPAVNFGNFINDLTVSASGANRVFSILDEQPQIVDRLNAKPLPMLQGQVTFENVNFGYLEGRDVLKDINFEIPAGTTVALVGATGSGKSTILSLIARFYEAQRGRVLLDGHDIRESTGESLRKQIAMVLQSNYLFSGSIMDNLRYGAPEATDEQIFNAARTLGVHERILSLKDGYDTPAGEKGAGLSLGERQLICFTRALVHNPRILLLDEATSALDPLLDAQVREALRTLINGRTTIIVTHRLSTAASADLVLMLERGRLIEMGTHRALLRQQGAYAQLYGASLASIRRRQQSEANFVAAAEPVP